MNCREFHDHLDEYLEGVLAAPVQEAAGAHLHGCAHCQRRLARLHERRAALRSMVVPPPRPDFFEQALLHARRPAARVTLWTRLAGAAVAAGVALWIGSTFLPEPARDSGALTSVAIAVHESRTVQLAFDAEHDLSNATLSIRLPAGVELRGFPGQREIRWETDLVRGVNMLALPLVGVEATDGLLQARLEHGKRSTEIKLQLRVTGPAPADARALPARTT